jgi:signal transduction histidine kinase
VTVTQLDVAAASTNGRSVAGAARTHVRRSTGSRGRVLVVEDEQDTQTLMQLLLEQEGYQVSFAENGREALWRLFSEDLPDIIVLDLRMPMMDGWEFRHLQKKDPKLSLIPVLAVSADNSAKAASISADAYLSKPLHGQELIDTIERVLVESEQQKLTRLDEATRLAALSRLAAGVGHEINNPLAFVLLNIDLALEKARPSADRVSAELDPERELRTANAKLGEISELLQCCQMGGERIRDIVSNLQRLSRQGEERRELVDVQALIEQSLAMVWNQIKPRARLVKSFGKLPPIGGNGAALGQVFLNLLVNAAHAIPGGDAEHNEIRVSTWVDATERGTELVVEVRDSGQGMAPEVAAHVFEPYFTTKPAGQGTGLGLALSLQTVNERNGRITVESKPHHGTAFRVFLPLGEGVLPHHSQESPRGRPTLTRGRILVIDDEPMIGKVVRALLRTDHDAVVVQSAAAGLRCLENGEVFDLILCDMAMPELSGPEFYANVAKRWPSLLSSVVFMTGGATTPAAAEFLHALSTPVLPKPFTADTLKRLVHDCLPGASAS